MTSQQLRSEFLNFFEKKGHKIVPSFSLLPTDPSVLFTTAGMQQFKEYFLGKKSPYGNRVTSCQKCFRTSDIEEVGDDAHLTFLEMLGNFSFGGYFKEEAIKFAYEFLINNLQLPISQLTVTVFGGDNEVPRDEESVKIWEKLGFSEKNGNLRFCGRADNFWGPTGEEGPCGPTTEIHIRGIEVWNLVFNEYFQDKNKKLTPLKQKGVDTGMGLERLAMTAQDKSSVFEIDLFTPLTGMINNQDEKAKRIIADHIKGAVFLISEGILPSNVEQGYVLRRILRRAIQYGKSVDLTSLARKVVEIYEDIYPELKSRETDILSVIEKEKEKFGEALKIGINTTASEIAKGDLDGETAFRLYQSHGFPLELIKEEAKKAGRVVDEEGFYAAQKKHQEVSRAGAEKKFKGGLADDGAEAVKYHTATHLLLAALREVLGPEIYQKGSNITAERLRFDFNYPQKMTDGQIKEIETLVNQKIREDLLVEMKEMSKDKALKIAKVSFDPEKYGEVVKVYQIGDFSIELCGGPHVGRTSELGVFKIIKEESSSAGIRRIRAISLGHATSK